MTTALDQLNGHRTALRIERDLRRVIFAPPPRLTGSEWADRFRYFGEGSPEEGRFRMARTPYFREVLDACCDPAIEQVVIMKSARVGYTEGVVGNVVGFHMHQSPCAMMVMQPTVDDAKGWSKENLDPMLRATPVLRGKVTESGRRDAKNTMQFKKYPGGFLVVTGANAASGLRRRSIRTLLGDEVDGFALSAKGARAHEGDPWTLAVKRTENYWDRKLIAGSTPTDKGTSKIEALFNLSDQRYYFVPCPHCQYMQRLVWSNIRWEDRDPETVHYVCGVVSKDGELLEGCGKTILEEHKPWMVARGEWQPQRPGRKTRGYHVWTAYSLLSSWSRMVESFLVAKAEGNEALKVFINQVLGETWEERGETVEEGSLLARRETYPAEVPAWAGVLTCGVDIQGDRLEYGVWGWGAERRHGLIKHEALWGDPGQTEVWRQLDAVLLRPWQHEGGQMLKIRATAIDTAGHHTQAAYAYIGARPSMNLFATKGSSEPGKAAIGQPSKNKKLKVRLFMLGSEALKDAVYSSLRVETPGPGYCHLPWVDEEYLRQLTGEIARTKYIKGRAYRVYQRRYERVEALDCACLARAALLLLGPIRDQLGKIVDKLNEDSPVPAPKPRRTTGTGWMGGIQGLRR